MSSSSDSESEILLGNKQLLAVFGVVALLLAIAFTGGYMLGKNSSDKKAAASLESGAEASPSVLTKTITPEDSSTKSEPPPQTPAASEAAETPQPKPVVHEKILGAPKTAAAPALAEGAPAAGQTFVQIAALTHIQASAMADVLRKKGFHSRIAPKPGNNAIYRVLVGPVKDAGDLSSTRDSLRKIGFREVIVQHY